MPYSEIQFEVKSRGTATGYPEVSRLVNGLQQNCNEETGLNTQVIAAGVGPTQLSQGSIAKGRFLFVEVLEDADGLREAIDIHVNASDADPVTVLTAGIEMDATTGLTGIWVTNNNANSVKFKWYISGDVTA